MDYGINLDAEAVREEVSDRVQHGSLDAEDIKYFESLSDHDINDAIHRAVSDSFWDAFDLVRSNAIDDLLDKKND